MIINKHAMKTQFNSSAVRNEVMNMQTTEVKTSTKLNKGTVLFIAYVVSALAVLTALSLLGLIPTE